MKGTVAFLPLDVAFFDGTVAPLLSERKIDPEPFVAEAARIRQIHWQVRRYARALETILAAATPPARSRGAGLWGDVKAYLEQFDWRPDELAKRALEALEPDLHLRGRPFFVAEISAAKVAATVDRYLGAGSPRAAEAIAREQIGRLDAELASRLVPEDGQDLHSDLLYRSDLLAAMTRLRDLASAARADRSWSEEEVEDAPARDVLRDELPWRAVNLAARVAPFWIARDVDGLETVCRVAQVLAPDCLVPAWRLFAAACEEFPDLKTALHLELRRERDVGAFVAPDDVPGLIDFLNLHGSRIIQAATRQGEGAACTTLLRKVRECATYAKAHGFGYLEASGILPPGEGEDEAASR